MKVEKVHSVLGIEYLNGRLIVRYNMDGTQIASTEDDPDGDPEAKTNVWQRYTPKSYIRIHLKSGETIDTVEITSSKDLGEKDRLKEQALAKLSHAEKKALGLK